MQDNYIQLFMTSVFAAGDPRAFFSMLFLFLARMLPIIAQAPFLGSRTLPNPVKVFLALTLFAIFLPKLLQTTTTVLKFNPYLVLLMFKELFIGILIGFLISVPFTIVQTTGMMIDHQRGGASLMVNDPTIQNQSTPIGTLFNMVMIYLFYVIDGPFLFLDGLVNAYEIVPIDQMFSPGFFAHKAPFTQELIKLLNDVMKIAIQLAAPALIAMLMTDMFLGIANRLAPQVQITFLGMPLKSLFGLAVICFGWQLMTEEYVHQLYAWVKIVTESFKLFRLEPAVNMTL